MAHHGHGTTNASHGHEHGHLIPYKVYVTVLLTLLFLTIVTVLAARVDFGSMNLVVAMLIASVKAGIVGLFFMHLKYEDPLIWIYVFFPIVLLAIMIGGIFIDNPYRSDPMIYRETSIAGPEASMDAQKKADEAEAAKKALGQAAH